MTATCAWCGLPFGMLPGCPSPEAAHLSAHEGHDGGNQPCRDCLVEPGERHHPLCCVAICTLTDEQHLCCECDLCLATTNHTRESHAELLRALEEGER